MHLLHFEDPSKLTIMFRYKPDVSLRFITDELAFESDQACCELICDVGGEHLFDQQTDGIMFSTGRAGQLFEAAKKSAYSKVDIKGQV